MILEDSLNKTSGSTLAAAIVIHACDFIFVGRLMPSSASVRIK